MKRISVIIYSLLFSINSFANDSVKVFSFRDLLSVVKTQHPVARQAGIKVDLAKANLVEARGGFDPVMGFDAYNKTFDGIDYYRFNGTQLSIPTWYGIEIHAGIEYLAVSATDPQETTGQTSYAGISIPLAKNLLMDKRRAALKQAKIMVNASEQERLMMLNSLMMEAASAYWEWVKCYFEYKTITEVIELNKKRIDLVKTSFLIGERAAIDTTEAITQLQQFEYLSNEALVSLQNARLNLGTFLWKENNIPVLLPDDVVPDKKIEQLAEEIVFPDLQSLLSAAKQNHPELNIYRNKLKVLQVEKKLKFQELLPKVDLKYNQLGKGYQLASTINQSVFDNNYTAGISVQVPLRLSKGRGEYREAKLKINETGYELASKENLVLNKVRSYYNQLVNYKNQANLLQKTYANYLKLQQAEETKFFAGESSLFLLNSRETKSLEMRIKLIETVTGFNKSAYTLQWAAGELHNL